MLAGAESYEWAAVANLDVFFARIYRWCTQHNAGTCCLSVVIFQS
jgi:hypothetical protein